jgi:hypothetical protein
MSEERPNEDRPKFSEVTDEEFRAAQRSPERRVATPAAGLVTVACLGFVANFCMCGLTSQSHNVERPAGMDDETYKAYEMGQKSAPIANACVIGIPTLAIYSLVLAGGLRMGRLRTYGLAMTAAILAMLPCSPAFVFSAPVGVWAWLVLRDPEVKAAFERG